MLKSFLNRNLSLRFSFLNFSFSFFYNQCTSFLIITTTTTINTTATNSNTTTTNFLTSIPKSILIIPYCIIISSFIVNRLLIILLDLYSWTNLQNRVIILDIWFLHSATRYLMRLRFYNCRIKLWSNSLRIYIINKSMWQIWCRLFLFFNISFNICFFFFFFLNYFFLFFWIGTI